MQLKTFVKINAITNLSDARYCAGMHVDLLGFNFDPQSESYITPEQFQEISGWLSGVKFVGESGNLGIEEIARAQEAYQFDYIETKSMEVAQHHTGANVILRVRATQLATLTPDLPIEMLIVETETPENLVDCNYKILIDSKFTPANVIELLSQQTVHGIALSGSDEIRPGYKDYDELADILEILEVDDWT